MLLRWSNVSPVSFTLPLRYSNVRCHPSAQAWLTRGSPLSPRFPSLSGALSYQSVRQLSSSGGGVVWSEKAKAYEPRPFRFRIPEYLDRSGVAKRLASDFQMSAGEEKYLLTLVDMPGTGKTTTVAEAARQLNAVYLYLSLEDVAMKAITDTMQGTYSGSLDGLTGWDVRQRMERVAASGLATILNNAAKNCTRGGGFNKLSNGALAEDLRQACEANLDDLDTAKRTLQEQLCSGQRVIVHVDEAQQLASEKTVDLKEIQVQPATARTASALQLTSLADALRRVQSTGDDPFRVILTGTIERIEWDIRISSAKKLEPARPALPEFTADAVKEVVGSYVSFPVVEQDVLYAKVWKRLSGPARSTQFFLDALWDLSREDTSWSALKVLESAVKVARARWSSEVLSRMHIGALPHPLAAQLFLAMVAPEGLGGSCQEDSTSALGYTIHLPNSTVPDEWSLYADGGAFRLKADAGYTLLYPAYPFLREALALRCAIVEPSAAEALLSLANSFKKNADSQLAAMGEVLLALESNILSSSLHSLVLLVTDNHRATREYGPLYSFKVNNEIRLGSSPPSIGIVDDTARGRGRLSRWCDVVVPLTFGNEEVAAYVEMKTGTTTLKKGVEDTATQFKKAFDGRDSGVPANSVFVFLSLHPLGLSVEAIKKLLLAQWGEGGQSTKKSPFHKVEVLNKTTNKRKIFKASTGSGVSAFFVVADLDNIPTFFSFNHLREVACSRQKWTISSLLEKLAPSISRQAKEEGPGGPSLEELLDKGKITARMYETEKERERERAEKERERAEKEMERAEKKKERAEKEKERERAEKEKERERAEKEKERRIQALRQRLKDETLSDEKRAQFQTLLDSLEIGS